jgi:tetratricopeptide (TPR) repeat protein
MYDFTFKKKLLSFIFCILLGLSFSLIEANLTMDLVFASNTIKSDLVLDSHLEEGGKRAYRGGDYQEALILWQKAFNLYRQQQDILGQGRVLSNLALAHYQLGNCSTAQIKIQQSRQLLELQQNHVNYNRTLGQVLNNQGIIELALGKADSAIANWDLAIATYQKAKELQGEIHARLNQAQALKSLGLYKRARDSLAQLAISFKNQPDVALKVVALRNYGELLLLMGELKQSQVILDDSLAIASRLSLATEEIRILLALGNTLVTYEDISLYQEALKYYQKGIKLCAAISGKTFENYNSSSLGEAKANARIAESILTTTSDCTELVGNYNFSEYSDRQNATTQLR